MKSSRMRNLNTVAVAALLLGAMGCGGDDAKTDTAKSEKAAGVDFVKSGQLTTCSTLPNPPFIQERDGKFVGFDVELIDLVAKKLDVKQVVLDTPFETIATGADLNARKCDIGAASLTITEDRKKSLDFSEPYAEATQALLVKKGSGITSLEAAKGKKVGTQSGSTGEDFVRSKGFDPVSFDAVDVQLNGLKSGQIDAMVQDLPVLTELLKDKANADLELGGTLNTGEQYGFATRKDGDQKLLTAINDTIASTKADGSYDGIYMKWFGVKAPSAKR